MRFNGTASVKYPFCRSGGLRVVVERPEGRQLLMLLLSILGRFGVGFCDLLVAAIMYLLFLLLQGRPTAHHLWWTPKTGLSAAAFAMAFVILRTLMDLLSSRSVFRLTQSLHTRFARRLTGWKKAF